MSQRPSVQFYGRSSYPALTAQQAFDQSQRGQFPAKSLEEAAPNLNLLVTDTQKKRVEDYLIKEFLPFCVEQYKVGNKEKYAMPQEDVDKLIAAIQGDPANAEYNIPFKILSDKSAELAPEAVGVVKVMGAKGTDFVLKAAVHNENELADPMSDVLKFPCILPLEETTHEFYPGCVIGLKVVAYSYYNGKRPGVSLSADTLVWRADADRFGGGAGDVDEDEFFLND